MRWDANCEKGNAKVFDFKNNSPAKFKQLINWIKTSESVIKVCNTSFSLNNFRLP